MSFLSKDAAVHRTTMDFKAHEIEFIEKLALEYPEIKTFRGLVLEGFRELGRKHNIPFPDVPKRTAA